MKNLRNFQENKVNIGEAIMGGIAGTQELKSVRTSVASTNPDWEHTYYRDGSNAIICDDVVHDRPTNLELN
jgi:hypothetical protein